MKMTQIYVSEKEHDLLVNLICDALLTRGALDSDGFNAAFSLLKKIGYPSAYVSELWNRTEMENYRYSFPQCNNDSELTKARLSERDEILSEIKTRAESIRSPNDGSQWVAGENNILDWICGELINSIKSRRGP